MLNNKSLRVWGSNEFGQLGDGTFNNSFAPIQLPDLKNVYKISAGGSHTVILDCGGELGDINKNGVISSFDVSMILQYTVDLINLNEAQICRADVNKSGSVTSVDAAYILQCAVGLCSNLLEDFLQTCQSYGNCQFFK